LPKGIGGCISPDKNHISKTYLILPDDKMLYMNLTLTDTEILELIKSKKYTTSDASYEFPSFGGLLSIELISENKTDFILDVNRNKYKLSKCTFQNRVKTIIPLVRLDVNANPHRNPDGTEIGRTHIHIFSSSFGDKVAYELDNIPKNFPKSNFTDGQKSIKKTFDEFVDYCNIVKKPKIENELF
jgi:hypothetical protein